MVMDDRTSQPRSLSPLWSLPLLCVGLAVVAICTLLPQVQANRRLAIEERKLSADLGYVKAQLATNEEFIRRVGGDTALAERLAQRQMKEIRDGSAVLPLGQSNARVDMSPFALMSLTPPPAMPAYRLPAGPLGTLCRHPKAELYLTGLGLFLVAAALVSGDSAAQPGGVSAGDPVTMA